MPDFTNLPIQSILALALLLAAVDTVIAMLVALVNGNFNGVYATGFLKSHIAVIVVPIALLAIIGHDWNFFGVAVPGIPGGTLAADAALAAYAANVVSSVKGTLGDKAVAPATVTTP